MGVIIQGDGMTESAMEIMEAVARTGEIGGADAVGLTRRNTINETAPRNVGQLDAFIAAEEARLRPAVSAEYADPSPEVVAYRQHQAALRQEVNALAGMRSEARTEIDGLPDNVVAFPQQPTGPVPLEQPSDLDPNHIASITSLMDRRAA